MVLCHNVCNVLLIFIHMVNYYENVIECVMTDDLSVDIYM